MKNFTYLSLVGSLYAKGENFMQITTGADGIVASEVPRCNYADEDCATGDRCAQFDWRRDTSEYCTAESNCGTVGRWQWAEGDVELGTTTWDQDNFLIFCIDATKEGGSGSSGSPSENVAVRDELRATGKKEASNIEAYENVSENWKLNTTTCKSNYAVGLANEEAQTVEWAEGVDFEGEDCDSEADDSKADDSKADDSKADDSAMKLLASAVTMVGIAYAM